MIVLMNALRFSEHVNLIKMDRVFQPYGNPDEQRFWFELRNEKY